MAISNINTDTPRGSDPFRNGDDEIRQLKRDVKESFPNVSGAVVRTHDELNKCLQTLSIEGRELTISDGNSVILPDQGTSAGDIYASEVIYEPTMTPQHYTVQGELDYLHGKTDTHSTNINNLQFQVTNNKNQLTDHEARLDDHDQQLAELSGGSVLGMAFVNYTGGLINKSGIVQSVDKNETGYYTINIDPQPSPTSYAVLLTVTGGQSVIPMVYSRANSRFIVKTSHVGSGLYDVTFYAVILGF